MKTWILKLTILFLCSFIANLNADELVEGVSPTQIGRVVHVGTEGGFWGIETTNQRYMARNLPLMLQRSNTVVRFQFSKPKENILGIHMWGQYVDLQHIEVVNCANQTE